MTDKKAKELLNIHYSENYTSEQAIEQLIYLTNKSRGKHTTRYRLLKAWQNRTLGNTLARLDPIAFNVSKSDLR